MSPHAKAPRKPADGADASPASAAPTPRNRASDLPDRLRAAREAIGWTRPHLAARTGYTSEATVWRYETGSRAPPPELVAWLEDLAAALDRLLANSPPPPPVLPTKDRTP